MSTTPSPWSSQSPGPAGPSSPAGYGAPSGYGAPLGWQGQPQQVRPGPQGVGPTGELVLDLRKPVGAMGMINPVVTIDGHPAPSSWGRSSFVVPAGVHQVEVAQSYLWVYGHAGLAAQVAPGTSVDVYYAGPMVTMLRGAIGLEPQRRPGQGAFVAVLVLVVVVLLIGVLAAVIGSS